MKKHLEGKTALVTGATSGIGLACARQLASCGVKVAIAGRRVGLLEEIARDLGCGTIPIATDVSDEGSATTAVGAAWERLDGIDYLIHAAGIVTPAAIEDLTPELWRQHIDVNLSGAFYVIRDCALRMRERGQGSIVAIASNLSVKGMPNFAHYCASKAGLVGLMKALALELAPEVRLNCVCPGPVETPMMKAELEWFGGTAEIRENTVAQVPLKRFASADEIAKFVLFVTTEADFATGSMLSIDGGTTAG
ncbi:NAD(P)-dependent dehydrogenase (short-subunit alcohol dehydrogenase family) [Sinorhizobium fredii]|uniref:3-oxoacyl-[acyl-carrier-protein] reductase FabG n=1 Tax=Sinorhizobium fredii (strain USDA 257) TaxID=1185652 RepID=I3X3E4_SINF2|nr:SDR family NAD(P)-dependent oxidoreductase [Sinorhizobium fredii]AFL50400.1 3-oxoacyl-[acyl-carrier-protein] reductase FabG [Sinorhizobium fredii USDA 257]